jgi:hypothetical protein
MSKEMWTEKTYAYRAKRKNRLFLNVLIEDIKSKMDERGRCNWILSEVLVEDGQKVTIHYSMFNNKDRVELTEEQKALTIKYALEISKRYFK